MDAPSSGNRQVHAHAALHIAQHCYARRSTTFLEAVQAAKLSDGPVDSDIFGTVATSRGIVANRIEGNKRVRKRLLEIRKANQRKGRK